MRNAGHTAAGPFDVVLTVGGAEQPPERVLAGLAPGASSTVTFLAPRCAPGSTLRFELDAEDEVDESSEARRRRRARLPVQLKRWRSPLHWIEP